MTSKPFKTFALLLTAIGVLSGCATVKDDFDNRDYLTPEAAAVFIYRPDTLINALTTPNVLVDGKSVFAIGNKQFHILQLPAGQYRIQLELTERYLGNHEVLLDTLNGQAYYLRIETAVKFQQNRPYDRYFDIQSVTETEAQPQLAQCKPLVAKKVEPATEPAATTTPAYSNQTFRNPFSR